MEGMWVSEGQTWWQRRARYLAGGIILFVISALLFYYFQGVGKTYEGINFLIDKNVFSNTNPINLSSF